MKVKLLLIIFCTITFLLLVVYKQSIKPVGQQQLNQGAQFTCTAEDLRIDQLPDFAQNNETIKNLMIDNCYWAIASQSDTDKDNDDEIVLQTMGYGCASCHAQDIFIIDGEQISFKYSGEDLIYRSTEEGFSITEPIRKSEEAYCCPSESEITEYKYISGYYDKANKYIIKNQK